MGGFTLKRGRFVTEASKVKDPPTAFKCFGGDTILVTSNEGSQTATEVTSESVSSWRSKSWHPTVIKSDHTIGIKSLVTTLSKKFVTSVRQKSLSQQFVKKF